MTKMEKIVLLMSFWFSPWGATKGATWEFFVHDRMEFKEDSFLQIMSYVINGIDAKYVDWTALEDFKEQTAKGIGIELRKDIDDGRIDVC